MTTFHQNTGLDWRTLDCWQCSQAKGKACHLRSYSSMTSITGSRDIGDQVCCRPGFSGENCETSQTMVCSQPYFEEEETSYTPILDVNKYNHQLFAFCSQTNQETCGISQDSSQKEMALTASGTSQTISTSKMAYVKGSTLNARYGSCYYEIGSKELSE